jgi:hypothetical protein
MRVGGGDQVLAVQPGLGGDLGAVDHEAAVGLLTQPATQRGVIAQRALGLRVRGRRRAFRGAVGAVSSLVAGLGDSVQLDLQAGDGVLALGTVAVGLFGVTADDVPQIGVVEVDFLDRRLSRTCR